VAIRFRFAAVLGMAALLGGCSLVPLPPEPEPLPRVAADFALGTLWYRQAQQTRPPEYAQPGATFHEGRVFHADRPDRIRAFDALSGETLWQVELRSTLDPELSLRINTALGAGDGAVYAGTREGRVLAFDAADGTLRWEARLASEVAAAPVVAGRIVLARSSDGRIYGLDADNGATRWLQESVVPPLSLRGAGQPLVDQRQVYAGLANGRLIAVSADSGEVAWETAIGIAEGRSEFERLVDVDAGLALADGTVFAAAYQARLAAVSTVSGRIQWSRDLSIHQDLLLDGELLFVTTEQAEVMALDRAKGDVLWRQGGLSGRLLTAPVLVDGLLVTADNAGYLHWLSPEDGRFLARIRVSDEAILETPVSTGDTLYVVDAAGALQALRRVGRAL
jgi:outer membrane protein assembly factor BamB